MLGPLSAEMTAVDSGSSWAGNWEARKAFQWGCKLDSTVWPLVDY